MYILEETCGILTTKRELEKLKKCESMIFVEFVDSYKYKSKIQEVAYAKKNADGTYTVEIVVCWTFSGPSNYYLALEPIGKWQHDYTTRTVENVKASSQIDAIKLCCPQSIVANPSV
jgi:hypothetical protein